MLWTVQQKLWRTATFLLLNAEVRSGVERTFGGHTMLAAKSFKLMLVSGSALAAVASAAPAWAQTEAPIQEAPAQPAADQDSSEILVTGSRIVRDGFKAPTPVTVVTLEQIQNESPSNNIADLVNQQPALAGSTKPANSRLNLSSGQAGINALNLRNLGEIRTLVLLDGRRSVGSTVTGLVDVNTIPQMLIKSVEISTGGASAAYGSDAVAGVVNFILDKKYEGFKVSADTGITTYGDGGNYSFDAALGKSFAGGRGHLLLSGEIAHRDGIFNVDRDWNATGYVRIQDPNWVAATSRTPRYLIRRQVGPVNSTPGSIITASAGGTVNRLRGTYFGANGQVLQYQYGALTFPAVTGTAALSLTQGGDWLVNDSGRRIGLDPADDRYGAFGRLSYEVVDGLEVFAEGSYNRQHVFFNAGPNLSTATLNATGCGTAPSAAAAPITCNAYLYNALGPTALTGITSVSTGTTFADMPFRAVDNKREVQRYLIGAESAFSLFGKDAHWDVYGQYGRANLREQLRNIQNVTRLTNASNAAFAPAGNAGGYATGSIQCLINVDASTTNNDAACVPLNRLGIGVANPAAINYVLGSPYRDEIVEQWVTGTNLAVTPFSTWAGDVSVSVGGEYRKEKIRGSVPAQFQPIPIIDSNGRPGTTNVWSVGNYLPTNGSYSVKEAYLETVIPLGLGIEFNGAVRATDYSTAGYVTTWKAGATWQPIDGIRFRVTRSRDIRAPNLNDLYQGGSANSDSIRNPIFTSDGANGPANYSYSGFVTGNPNLRAEKADSWNVGAVLSPSFVPGFNLSVDYFRINLKEGINTFSAQQIADLCYAQKQQSFCDAISVDTARSLPNQPYLLIRSQPFNAASQLVRGIDIDGSYRLPLDRLFGNAQGSFTLRGVATRYIDNLFNSGVPGTVVLNSVGVNGGQTSTPTWIYRFSAAYETPTFSLTAVARGVSSGKYAANGIECSTACPADDPNFFTYDDNHVSGLFYVDLNLSQKVAISSGSDAQFFVNVTNLFNRWPLLVPETGLAANSTYSDLLGRTFRVGIRFQLR
jgi:iron complex outermembrane receptor protein